MRLCTFSPSVAALVASTLLLAAGEGGPPRYWPLDPGNTWLYAGCDPARGGECTEVMRRITVLSREGDVAQVAFAETELVWGLVNGEWLIWAEWQEPEVYNLREVPGGIDLELPGEGFVTFYRFEEETFVHRDFSSFCDDGVLVGVGTPFPWETPVGVFECVGISYGCCSPQRCGDWGKLSEVFCRDVGLVYLGQWQQPSRLELWSFGRVFVRGDANASGSIALDDAVFVLSYLFRGNGAPPCLDAADADGDGDLALTDAIYLLGWLFRGSSGPPAPAPSRADGYPREDCGPDDIGDDGLDCAEFPPCGSR